MEATCASPMEGCSSENESRWAEHRQYICPLVSVTRYGTFHADQLKTGFQFGRGLVNPAPGVFDFDGYRSLTAFYDAAMSVGLWVILRPGPYINAGQ